MSLSYSEAGNDNISRPSRPQVNPWGVSLKKLSFKNVPQQQQQQQQQQKEAQQPNGRPSRPKSLRHSYEKSDVIPLPTFTSSTSNKSNKSNKEDNNNSNTNTNDNQTKSVSRAKKRKLRRQLSLVKMQMSVLKARLGLEQMRTPNPINEDYADNLDIPDDVSTDLSTDLSSPKAHSRSVSVSSENLLATIESMSTFESDIKDAIQKVDDLMHQVNQTDTIKQTETANHNDKQNGINESKLMEENKKLKQEIDKISKQLQTLQTENKKLTLQLKTKDKAPQSVKSKEFKPDPLEKYSKMKDLGMSIDKIMDKMTKAGIDSKQIEQWKQKNSSNAADQVLAAKINAKEMKYVKYDKMRKIGMPEASIRNKMVMDGFKPDEIDRYFGGGGEGGQENKKNEQDEWKEKMKKYDKMKNIMKMNEWTIRNRMTLDGISKQDQERYFNPESAKKKDEENNDDEEENKPNPALAKYEKMRKMG